MKDNTYTAFIEGFNEDNPGLSGVGIVIFGERNRPVAEISRVIGQATLDQARFKAIILTLQEARSRKIKDITIYSGSEVFVRQFQGIYKVMDPVLKRMRMDIRKDFPEIRLKVNLVSAGEIARAEELAKMAIEKQQEKTGFDALPIKMSMTAAPISVEPGKKPILDIQRSAGGVVYRKAGNRFKICMIAKNNKTVWALPKGRVDAGETPEETAVREVTEETGNQARVQLLLDEIDYYFFWRENNTFYHKFVYFFLMPLVRENVRQRDNEADAVIWITPEQALRKATYINEKDVIRKAKKIFDATVN